MTRPEALRRGDTVAILAPASVVAREYVDGASAFLRECGFKVRIYPSAAGDTVEGSYSGSSVSRLAEFRDAWGDPEVKCVLCARGGYGCVHLLTGLQDDFILSHPKWLVGFSDVSALHALLSRNGIMSLHAPMCKHLATRGSGDPATAMMLDLLSGGEEGEISAPPTPFNIHGSAEGILAGGNLAVLNSLAGTGFDLLSRPLQEDCILFLEDIAEAIYAVERMLFRLHLGGVLEKVKGLIVGQFTEYKPDRNFPDMESMISRRLRDWGVSEIPVAFRFPVGHIETNFPMLVGGKVSLTVDASGADMKYING